MGFSTPKCPQMSPGHLEDVISRRDIGDVDPLTVDIGVVGVVTARAETLQNGGKMRINGNKWE